MTHGRPVPELDQCRVYERKLCPTAPKATINVLLRLKQVTRTPNPIRAWFTGGPRLLVATRSAKAIFQ